jgi:hypothetical protein
MQEGQGWNGRYDVRTDAVCVYGVDDSLPERVASWRARGYSVFLMTGLAWGHYQDFLDGHWDGKDHWDEAQRHADGTPKLHGTVIPYMTPSKAYADYLGQLLRQALNAGVEAIFLEEPEYWAYTGYGPGFERAWYDRYNTPYRNPAADAGTFLMGSRLKYTLYTDLIQTLSDLVHRHPGTGAATPGRCYVATHSLLNYAHNRIVSPMHAIRGIPCDGYILQVWSHTARSQVMYEGVRGEHIFEVAFLEYGSGLELTRGADRDLWFLADPVEDSPKYGWDRYRSGYETTVAASLFYPGVYLYEVMPWPSRVFTGRYPKRPDGPAGDPIPADYAAELLAIANALSDMPSGSEQLDSGTHGIGMLTADSLMFRRAGPDQDDPELSAFYGLALPPLMVGMPVRPISLETVAQCGIPVDIRVLLLSYDGMTPPSAEAHEAIAGWTRAGNALLLFGAANGPYETAPGWWNQGESTIGPWPHLHALLGITGDPGLWRSGTGVVLVEPEGPIALARAAGGANLVRARLRQAMAALGETAPPYHEQGYLVMKRGRYVVAAALYGAPVDEEGYALRLGGTFVDMFDGTLSIRESVNLRPGDTTVLLDLQRLPFDQACVVAASGRVSDAAADDSTLRFRLTGPINTPAVARLRLPRSPREVTAIGEPLDVRWDDLSRTVLIRHHNSPDGVSFAASW